MLLHLYLSIGAYIDLWCYYCHIQVWTLTRFILRFLDLKKNYIAKSPTSLTAYFFYFQLKSKLQCDVPLGFHISRVNLVFLYLSRCPPKRELISTNLALQSLCVKSQNRRTIQEKKFNQFTAHSYQGLYKASVGHRSFFMKQFRPLCECANVCSHKLINA